ncbi:MAG TPA: GTP 3',8-cyclase MoaA [Euzebya sp.]|nr:GTP 3',8-cyclase MoaA [Euzebya sp.]
MITDVLGRGLTDLRVSVTDRCNFRCTYCKPRDQFGPGHAFLPRQALLTFEEIARVVAAASWLGVRKVRLTGGEPLLRRELHVLVAALRAIDGIEDIAMTTNGVLLPDALPDLVAAGLDRVTVSLDALDPAVFAQMADVHVGVDVVTHAIDAALDAGLAVKVNTVVQKGVNESQILPLVEYGRQRGVVVRFIEFMDVGSTNGWTLTDVVTARQILDVIAGAHPVRALSDARGTAVAERWAYADGAGEVGVIASVSQPFCSTCVRARLSAVGELFTCLFATKGHDLRRLLRGPGTVAAGDVASGAGNADGAAAGDVAAGLDDGDLRQVLSDIWGGRADRYSELRHTGQSQPRDRVEMSYIGG